MVIRRFVSFYLQPVYGSNKAEAYIRMRVRWESNVLQFNVGHSITPEKWIKKEAKCRKGAFNEKGVSAFDINKDITRLETLAHDAFKGFEVQEQIPTVKEYKNTFEALTGKRKGAFGDHKSVKDYFIEFQNEQGVLNSWSDSTHAKFKTLCRHLTGFRADISPADFDTDTLRSFLDYLIRDCGQQNTTAMKSIKLLMWFLRWCEGKGYIKNKECLKFSPKLRTVTDREVIFLTWDELMHLFAFKFPDNKEYLSRARDIFCFQCFTSLRYSDVLKLKRNDIRNKTIYVVTTKTGDTVKIELNKHSEAILKKYESLDTPLPIMSNQKANEYIKEACFICGINTLITVTHFKGNERTDEVKPKYELISTHAGRRTFICNALMMGISASTVMSWTGHSDYKAMKPYIGVADAAKREAMELFNK